MTTVNELLTDEHLAAVTTDDGTGVLVDWWEFDNQPQAIVEVKLSGGWHPIQCDLHSFRCNMGRDLTDEPVEVGVAQLWIDNTDGRYTRLTNGNISLSQGTEIRLRLRHPTANNSPFGESVVWIGNVVEVVNEWSVESNMVRVEAVDALGLLAEQGGALSWRSGDLRDTVADRLWHLLERVGLFRTRTFFEHDDLAAGLINPELSTTSVLDEAHTTALTDGGRFMSEPSADGDAVSFVYLNRHRIAAPPGQIGGYLTSSAPRSTTERNRNIEPERVVSSSIRPGQNAIPAFSDWCGVGRDALPYIGLSEVTWRGWERPSIVAVANEAAPQVRDRDGELQDEAWHEYGALAPTGSRRHSIVEYTQLRLNSQRDADELAMFYAEVHARANVVIDELVIAPHVTGVDSDTRNQLWDAIAGEERIRQGDWITVERHLTHDRFVATCSVEGITYSLLPGPDGGEPDWTATYKLHALDVHTYEIPPEERPPLPPGHPGFPPLPPGVPDLDIANLVFTQKGTPPWHFAITIHDPARATDHQALAFNSEYGIVELNLAAVGTYNAQDEITRQYADTQLAPGDWLVWVRDAANPSRMSAQEVITVDDWGDLTITNTVWAPDGETVFTVTDGRYPLAKPRVWANGKRTDEMWLPVVAWNITGNPATSDTYEVRVNTAKLMPDEWEFRIVDAGDRNRESNEVTFTKVGPSPTGFKLGVFTNDGRDVDAWDSIPVVWNAVTVNGVRAEQYRVEYRESSDPTSTIATRTTPTPGTSFTGPRTSGDVQASRTWTFRVQARVNGVDGAWSGWRTVETGYPYIIVRTDFEDRGPAGRADSNTPVTIRLPSFRPVVSTGHVSGGERPNWTQDNDPSADNFVGVHVESLRFQNLTSQGIAPDGTHIVHPRLRFYGAGALDDIRVVINGVTGLSLTSNPTTPFTGDFRIEQAGGGEYGLRLTGTAWGPYNVAGGSWIEWGEVAAEGDIYTYYGPKWPVLT